MKPRLVSVYMGLGHLRAAAALRSCINSDIIIDGSSPFCPPDEYRLWERMRQLYYFLSRAEEIPVIGRHLFRAMHAAQDIPAYYPRRDLSAPTTGVKYLHWLITSGRLGRAICAAVDTHTPVLNTFYASAMALEYRERHPANYLLICDADFNRVWVPRSPRQSSVIFLAPGMKVKRRLLATGIPEQRIHVTGFPLPPENIGSAEHMEILKADLAARLARLDPRGNFAQVHGTTVEYYLGPQKPATQSPRLTILFSVGGSGAQVPAALSIARSLKLRILSGEVRLLLAAGIRPDVHTAFQRFIDAEGLQRHVPDDMVVLHDSDIFRYFELFNAALRLTDVLWTKPSELSFYCALGLPIIMTTPVGTHEEINSRWLQDIHAGITPPGPLECAHEWLFDLWESGLLAETAWDGFLKGRKLGAYKIARLLATGSCTDSRSPLER